MAGAAWAGVAAGAAWAGVAAVGAGVAAYCIALVPAPPPRDGTALRIAIDGADAAMPSAPPPSILPPPPAVARAGVDAAAAAAPWFRRGSGVEAAPGAATAHAAAAASAWCGTSCGRVVAGVVPLMYGSPPVRCERSARADVSKAEAAVGADADAALDDVRSIRHAVATALMLLPPPLAAAASDSERPPRSGRDTDSPGSDSIVVADSVAIGVVGTPRGRGDAGPSRGG